MPSTINGIGTHYYGKKNRSNRTAACQSCGKVGVLESYDTRLWFVIVFIPVIPLGRKRITDNCPRCTRHYVVDLHKYEQARQLQTSASLDRYRREPSVETALEAHGQLLAFHENEQATKFRETALARFPDHAALRANLAAQLEHAASYDESANLYEAALKQDPEMPEARVGVARRRMVRGELDQARRLLDFLEVAGAGKHHALGPLDVLSDYYQKAGRHEEALALAAILLREIPEAGRQHAFRSFVLRSEKALGRFETILPQRQHSLRGLFRSEGSPYSPWQRNLVIWGGAATLLAGGLLLSNEYIRRHRMIHVVSACVEPVLIQVDQAPPVEFTGTGRLSVGEGRHRVTMTGAVLETSDVDLQAGYFDRWFKKPLWVLNPGGEAVLQESTVYYAENPQPSTQRLLVGHPFVSLPHVDYPFEQPPGQLQVKKGEQLVKTSLEWIRGRNADAFVDAYQTNRAGAISFAERRLRRFPDENDLLNAYLRSVSPEQVPHVEEFLKSGLDRRPVVVPWHRAYQGLAQMNGHDQGLLPLYDGFLKTEPSSGAFNYLRGRIDPDPNRQIEYYQRAAAADPRLPWPWLALGARAAASGRWNECMTDLNKARDLNIDPEQIRDMLHVARLATGGAEGLVLEYRGRLAANAMDFSAVGHLCDALIAAGHPETVESELKAWELRLNPQAPPIIALAMRALALYQLGKLEECERLCAQSADLRGSSFLVQSKLAMGRAKEVAKDPAHQKLGDEPWGALSVTLGLYLEGQQDDAARWLEQGCKRLESLSQEYRKAARFLGAAGPMPVDDLSSVSIDADDRALIFAILAERFPGDKAGYHAAAARFNIERKPPYQLVRRALGGVKPALP